MYPAALHILFTHTVNSSHVIERSILEKATKTNQQKDKKPVQKDNQRSGAGLSLTTPRFSFLIDVLKDIFFGVKYIFLNGLIASMLFIFKTVSR